jgi:hypothetical protein
MAESATVMWCSERGHPFITYNPHTDRSYCRCGERQADGDQPQDWTAKREVFHTCGTGDCRCYVGGKHNG